MRHCPFVRSALSSRIVPGNELGSGEPLRRLVASLSALCCANYPKSGPCPLDFAFLTRLTDSLTYELLPQLAFWTEPLSSSTVFGTRRCSIQLSTTYWSRYRYDFVASGGGQPERCLISLKRDDGEELHLVVVPCWTPSSSESHTVRCHPVDIYERIPTPPVVAERRRAVVKTLSAPSAGMTGNGCGSLHI